MNKKQSVVIGLAAAAVLTTMNAQAAIITDNDSFADQLTEISSAPLRVDLFNPSLGTLDRVIVTIGASLRSQGNVTNSAAQGQDFSVSTLVQQYDGAVAIGGPTALTDPFSLFSAFDLIGSDAYTALAPSATAAFGAHTTDSGSLTILDSTDTTILNEFLGTADFGYDLTTQILTSIQGGGGNILTGITTFTSAQLSVQYEYTAAVTNVPEPGTLSLVALGLLAAGRRFATRTKK